MTRKTLILSVIAVVAVLVTTSAFLVLSGFSSPGATDRDVNQQLAEVRQATAKYHDVSVAEADGFEPVSPCIEEPGLGGMGVHYLNHDRLDDPVDPLKPELLLYVPDGDGGLELVGVEYFVPALVEVDGQLQPWFDEEPPAQGFVTEAPELFGVTFDGPMPGHGPGEPWHFDLHVWLWQANPDGVFETWNRNVSCGA